MITGIHHVSMTTTDMKKYEESRKFYTEIIGLKLHRQWPAGFLLDTGAGYVEVFNNSEGEFINGSVEHFALACDDVDSLIEKIEKAGYEVTKYPKDVVIPSSPEIPARIAFFTGPLGEKVELFDEK